MQQLPLLKEVDQILSLQSGRLVCWRASIGWSKHYIAFCCDFMAQRIAFFFLLHGVVYLMAHQTHPHGTSTAKGTNADKCDYSAFLARLGPPRLLSHSWIPFLNRLGPTSSVRKWWARFGVGKSAVCAGGTDIDKPDSNLLNLNRNR